MQVALPGITSEKSESLQEPQRRALSKKSDARSFSSVLEHEQTKEKPDDGKDPQGKKSDANDKKEEAHKALGKKAAEPAGELGGLFHFLYDLVYKNPAEWSIAEREHYGVEKGQVSPREFEQMLSDRNLSLHDLSYENLSQMSRLSSRRQLTVFLDKLLLEMESGAANDRPSAQKDPYAGIKTSLQELEHEHGVREEQILKEITRQISLRKIREGTQVNILLNPKHLGDLKLDLILAKGEIKAHFKTRSQKLKEILETNLDELAQAFSKQGLRIKALEVEKIS